MRQASTKTKTSTPKRKQPKDHIPRPPNGFIMYRSDKIKELKGQQPSNPHSSVIERTSQMSKQIAKSWHEESQQTREMYLERGREAARQHMIRHPDYQYRPRRRHREHDEPADDAASTTSTQSSQSSSRHTNSDAIANGMQHFMENPPSFSVPAPDFGQAPPTDAMLAMGSYPIYPGVNNGYDPLYPFGYPHMAMLAHQFATQPFPSFNTTASLGSEPFTNAYAQPQLTDATNAAGGPSNFPGALGQARMNDIWTAAPTPEVAALVANLSASEMQALFAYLQAMSYTQTQTPPQL